MRPTLGRIVHFKLRDDDAAAINRRRTTGTLIRERITTETWPAGAQAHIGNFVNAGEVYPLVICRVWPDEFGPGIDGVNGQVLLDGNDSLWVTSVGEGQEPGEWVWPALVK